MHRKRIALTGCSHDSCTNTRKGIIRPYLSHTLVHTHSNATTTPHTPHYYTNTTHILPLITLNTTILIFVILHKGLTFVFLSFTIIFLKIVNTLSKSDTSQFHFSKKKVILHYYIFYIIPILYYNVI